MIYILVTFWVPNGPKGPLPRNRGPGSGPMGPAAAGPRVLWALWGPNVYKLQINADACTCTKIDVHAFIFVPFSYHLRSILVRKWYEIGMNLVQRSEDGTKMERNWYENGTSTSESYG